ncbi:MAG: hypothetical protein R3B74_08740 [Nitrospirales bacterium]|nr:hypothetical protein [Nitrospirales bacterium]
MDADISKCEVPITTSEYEFWVKGNLDDPMYQMQAVSFNESVKPVVDAGLMNFIDVNTDLGDGLSVFSTPGHT